MINDFKNLNTRERIVPIMERLTRIFNSKFSCDFKFRLLDELSQEEKDIWCSKYMDSSDLDKSDFQESPEQESLKQESHEQENNERVKLPIFIKKDLIGILEANLPSDFDYKRLNNLTEMVSSLVETLYSALYKSENLIITEDKLLSLKEESASQSSNQSSDQSKVETPSNVILLDQYLVKNHQVKHPYANSKVSNHLSILSSTSTKDFHGNFSTRKPCLIISSRIEDIQKMILNIHESSRSYALVSFWDLDHSIRHSLEELKDLGNINLFIPNIVRLSDIEIFNLTQLLKLPPSAAHPNILAGSTLPLGLLLEKKIIPTELIRLLSQTYFHIDKPFSEYKREGHVNHFLREYFSTI